MNFESFFTEQLAIWPDARQRYQDLAQSVRKQIEVEGRKYQVVFNPARMRSAAAKVEGGKVDRPCFLCANALPQEQTHQVLRAVPSGREYWLMVNPYPITDRHFTIVSTKHERQSFAGREWDMAYLADVMPDYLIFFNGACSGASAPDHMHFQAVPKELVPITSWDWQQLVDMGVSDQMPHLSDAESDHCNVVCWTDGSSACHWLVIRRRCHRPSQYPEVLISPASLEFCGLVPMARQEDFDRMNSSLLCDILAQCREQEPVLHVGIMEGQQICFSADERTHALNYVADGRMLHVLDYGSNRAEKEELQVYTANSQPFTLEGVTIGKQFHWEQKEDQTFMGSLRIIANHGQLHAINSVPVEEYLKSVISSEMSATNNLELLKTHAIISRSWVLRQIADKGRSSVPECNVSTSTSDHVFWDHSNHTLFDVCADDHCQRYQGITRQATSLVAQAIEETRGQVLMYDGELCDCRFSKCCGGRTELFSSCWQDTDYSYLQVVDDPWCNTSDERVLRLVLNDYDQRTIDFHDWSVQYTQEELTALVRRRLLEVFTDPDSAEHQQILHLGLITALEPVKVGPSGRIITLRIVGEGGQMLIGKELLIRKALSESHLYSSAFSVTTSTGDDGQLIFTLTGKGWGHGVGLCQIGAANMSQQGFTHTQILAHYFPGAQIQKRY